ncbi:MAG: 30S ribosomal protein S16 [Planctomycetota bacterium]|nr:30S ribosomal protein S16 [Planctomycetota bacterium]MEE2712544.1 30S ribosomal protein S16 [Planctomycetota bacterium]
MAVRIRLTRIGRMHRPFYRIAAYDSRTRRDGRALEYLGYYDPLLTTGTRVKLDKEKAEAWIAKGAQPSETVASFLREIGVQYKKAARNRKRNKARAAKRKSATPKKK